jgi:hypothetical protein
MATPPLSVTGATIGREWLHTEPFQQGEDKSSLRLCQVKIKRLFSQLKYKRELLKSAHHYC